MTGARDAATSNASVFVIVPAFNEGPALFQTLTPLIAEAYTVIVVDDGSSDNTFELLGDLPVIVLRHAINLGQGAALQTGMDYALMHGAEFAIHFDADGQHTPGDIPKLLEPIRRGKADVVLGSRFLRDEDAAVTPLGRRALLRMGIFISGLFTGVWLSDTHNGFRALSRTALEKIHLRENGFAHATEILGQIRRNKLRYVEVPTAIHYSDYSRNKGQRFWSSFDIVIDLLMEKLFR